MEDKFSNRLQKAMQIRNIKASELSEKANIPKSAISQYLSGLYEAKQKSIFKLANVLDVSEGWLMGYDIPMEKNFKVDATKDHSRKANSSYNAIHEMLHMHAKYTANSGINPETFPEVEIQYWDEELREKCLYGELSYANYKSKDLIAISERLENDRENVLSDLPVFYTIEGNKIKRLSKQDSLYKMYPEIKRIEEGKRQGEEAAI